VLPSYLHTATEAGKSTISTTVIIQGQYDHRSIGCEHTLSRMEESNLNRAFSLT